MSYDIVTGDVYQELLTHSSKLAWKSGARILQGNRLGPTDEAHVAALFKHMGLTEGHEADVADMGCGFGEVSRILSTKHLPNAKFYLVNNNWYQLEKCAEWAYPFHIFYQDMCNTKMPEYSMDLVMFNWSLCHADQLLLALNEARRIARTGAKLFVFDYERIKGDNRMTQQHLHASFYSDRVFRRACTATRWRDVQTIHCGGDNTIFRDAARGHEDRFYRMLSDLRPVIWTATKTSRS